MSKEIMRKLLTVNYANKLTGWPEDLRSLGCNKGIVFLLWFHAASSLMSSI
ncbi:hypothetical protein D3C76_1054120 [compost metagenome]